MQVASDYLEGDTYISIAEVFPVIKGLSEKFKKNDEDSRTVAQVKEALLASFKTRFKFIFDEDSSCLFEKATWLHPTYKNRYFKSNRAFRVS